MIYFFTGKPGNGKSLHMAMIMYKAIKRGQNVIANFEINESVFDKCRHREKLGTFIYENNAFWLNNAYKNNTKRYSYLDGLYSYALQFHVKSVDAFNAWYTGEGKKLHEEMARRFGRDVAGFSTWMEEIDTE